MSARIDELPELDLATIAEINELIGGAPDALDNPPISERGLIQLRAAAPVRHLLARTADGERPTVGYAQLDGAGSPPTAELIAADPGTAAQLLAELNRLTADDGLLLWAHGAASMANDAALRAGLTPTRTLLQLRRDLTSLRLDEPRLPAGVAIRPFAPGQDETAWLAVNARAFADHPEQGGWTERDLASRLGAEWFDPAGFLLAERQVPDGPAELIGYHWTKVHPPATAGAEPLGEVYVLGVSPAAQGLRLGTLLLNEGLRHLQSAGLSTVLLYVEETNSAAVHLYARAGFTVFATDIQYRRRR